MHGVLTSRTAMMRDGMENLDITEREMDKLGVPALVLSSAVSCENHGGPGLGAVTQWDAAAGDWNLISDFKASDKEVIDALIEEDSMAFAAENNIDLRCN